MRIMFIDDDERRMQIYVAELVDNGHEVIFRDDIDLALATLRDPAEHFDLVVLDISMPPGTEYNYEDTIGGSRAGIPLYDTIRSERPGLKIVAFTNVSDPRLAEHFAKEDQRLCLFLRKPDNLPIQFAKKIENFLSETNDPDVL